MSVSFPVSAVSQSLFLLGVVLVEAVILYLGYGYVEQRVAPPLLARLQNS